MQLNIGERLNLLNMLSGAKGNLATLRIVSDLQNEAGLSEEEYKAINGREKDGKFYWDEGKIPPKEIAVGATALETLLSIFKRLEQMEELSVDFLPLYEKLLREKHERTPKLHEAGAPVA